MNENTPVIFGIAVGGVVATALAIIPEMKAQRKERAKIKAETNKRISAIHEAGEIIAEKIKRGEYDGRFQQALNDQEALTIMLANDMA